MGLQHIQGLRVDNDNGVGDIKLGDAFTQRDALFRADVIKDWIYYLEILSKRALEDMDQESYKACRARGGEVITCASCNHKFCSNGSYTCGICRNE